MNKVKNLNNTTSKEWLNLITEFLSNNNSQSTKAVTESLGTENSKFKRGERGSKFLIPKNSNFDYVAINPDLEENDTDKPVSFLEFGGEKLNLKLEYLIELFPNVELVENTYDGGVQLFFYPVDRKFDFTAASCSVLMDCRGLDELRDVSINEISFMYKTRKVKTRLGFSMID